MLVFCGNSSIHEQHCGCQNIPLGNCMFLIQLFYLSNNLQAYWKYEVATMYCMLSICRGHAPKCLFRALQGPFPAEVYIVPRSSVTFRVKFLPKTKSCERVCCYKLICQCCRISTVRSFKKYRIGCMLQRKECL